MKLNIVGTFGKDYAKNQDNNDSLVVSLEHLGTSFLFAGAIEKQRIADMLSQDVYKRQVQRFPQNGWKPFEEYKGRREPDCETEDVYKRQAPHRFRNSPHNVFRPNYAQCPQV